MVTGIPNSAYRFQTLGNAVSFISALIAALLYGNIGIKIFYSAVLRDVFRLPPLDKKIGKWIWVALGKLVLLLHRTFTLEVVPVERPCVALSAANNKSSTVPIYWALAWIVAAAIPQIANLTSFVGAACILQFSYTFPPIFVVGYNVQKDAMLPEEEFDPRTGLTNRVDSGLKRWIRGYKKKFFLNTFDVLYSLGALATAGLGIWASITGMHNAFLTTPVTPFTCANPAG